MRRVLDSNIGDADFDKLFDSIIGDNPHLNKRIEDVHNENNMFLCEILRIYPYVDKAFVRILNNDDKVYCRLSHEILGKGISIDYLPDGVEKTDNNKFVGEKYIEPYDKLFGVVIQVRWDNLNDENVLLQYVNIHGDNTLRSSNDAGEISVKSGSSIISVTDERVNIMTPALFVNGLPYNEPELDNYYDKKEIDLITNTVSSNVDFTGLLNSVEEYKQTSDSMYTLFRGDCWTINSNYESSVSITTEPNSDDEDESGKNNCDFSLTGTFRTDSDLIGIYWNSKDLIEHPYISYGERYNYKNVILEFDYEMSGCRDWADGYDETTNPCVMTINKTDGSIYYLVMYQFITDNHVMIDFDNLYLHEGNAYINGKGEEITVDSDMKVSVDDIESIMLLLKPAIDGGNYNIIENVDFDCKVTNIEVVNGDICYEHIDLEPHPYRLCEGYDDFYNLNPKRVCREMRKLGYTEWCDLYIGASHFYEKSGLVGDRITDLTFDHNRTEKMVLDTEVPLNRAFSSWLDCYSRELKNNDCPNLVISVSMENLQCPKRWRQRDCDGNFALTGWIPSTFFYSPCNEEVLPYMQSVSEACLDIVVANGLPPILQLGEAWWWWNENDIPKDEKGNRLCEKCHQPPCFYDNATRVKYSVKFHKKIPEYDTSWEEDFDEEMMMWLNHQIVEYSWGLREVVKKPKYENGLYTALFFPPSVLDEDRVPLMMQKVNYLRDIYSPSHLDILQLEDYDWVTGSPVQPETKQRDREHHPIVYSLGQELGFTEDRIHYFGGFVQYEKDAIEFWREIKKAMDDGLEKGFAEVYVWAGSQVRRDKKILGYDNYELVQHLLYR